MVPSHFRISELISFRYSWITASTSSALIASDIAVKPRMSTNINVSSRRSPFEVTSLMERESASCREMRGSTYWPKMRSTFRRSRSTST